MVDAIETPIKTSCVIAGGGPAGVMLGVLLARAGVPVVVLEKHADFLRDFRGDTVHPSTLDVIDELGLLPQFLARPHQELRRIRAKIGERSLGIGDFAHTPTRCHFIALMPQWDFLDFLAQHGRAYAGFDLRMQAEATGLLEADGRIVGITATTPQGPIRITADLVIGADGRHSLIRERAGLQVEDFGAPIDVLWMRLPKSPADPVSSLGYFNFGRVLVTLDRGDYWQCAFVIRKGGLDELRARGLPAVRQEILRLAPFFADRVAELDDWDKLKLLTVKVDRLRRWWRPGLLCLGDAAHAMSPIGGVGINLAVQDAVAAANLLALPLRERRLRDTDLQAVEDRRSFPTRMTQRMQLFVQGRIGMNLGSDRPVEPPAILRLIDRFPLLQRIPARLVGVGFRPEHVATPKVAASRAA